MVSRVFKSCLVVMLLAGGLSPVARARTGSGDGVLSRIEAAAVSGRLDYETALLYKVRAVLAPERLPAEFRAYANQPIKCGTPVITEAMQAAPSLSPDFQTELAAMTTRVPTDSVYLSPNGHFLLHYDLDSANAVPSDDLDSSGFPDFIEKLAIYFDSAWTYQVNTLGWSPPPFDGVAGGDSLYDVYPTSIGLTYGLTFQEAPGPEPWDDWSSYIYVNKAFVSFPANDDPEGKQAGSMKATATHEFNHACQFADNPLHMKAQESWWQEITATWMEDVVYDTVNDNYNYLDEFFPWPAVSLYDGSDHKYGAFVFGKFIEENLSVAVIRQAWENMRWTDAVTAINDALIAQGTSFPAVFGTFAGWNYFTDTRDDNAHYEEGARYLAVPIARVDSVYPFTGHPGTTLQAMAADYTELIPDHSGQSVVELSVDGPGTADWQATVWVVDSAGFATEYPISIDPLTGDGTVYFGGFAQAQRAVLAVSNVALTNVSSSYWYSVDFVVTADCDDDGGVGIFDVIYLIDFIYNGGPAPVPIWQVGDLNCSGGIDILDLSVMLDYALKNGPTPCPPLD